MLKVHTTQIPVQVLPVSEQIKEDPQETSSQIPQEMTISCSHMGFGCQWQILQFCNIEKKCPACVIKGLDKLAGDREKKIIELEKEIKALKSKLRKQKEKAKNDVPHGQKTGEL